MTSGLWQRYEKIEAAYKAPHGGPSPPNTLPWAIWTADGSEYLEKYDAVCDFDGVVDIAHVRWATMNAITAIDLCAATLGRMFCGHTGLKELDLRAFDRRVNRRRPNRTRGGALSGVLKWICRAPVHSSPPTADE